MLFIGANVESKSLIILNQYTSDLSDHSPQFVEIILEGWKKRVPNSVKTDWDNNMV